jgi:hypothetical protein
MRSGLVVSLGFHWWLACAVLSTSPAQASFDFSPTCSRAAAPGTLPEASRVKPVSQPVSLDDDGIRAAMDLVYRMENGVDPYRSVTGNFDGQGLSLGIIQFNLGGSVQKAFAAIPKAVYDEHMPEFGDRFYDIVHSPREQAIKLSFAFHKKTEDGKPVVWELLSGAREELASFLGAKIVRDAQNRGAGEFFGRGYNQAALWAKETRNADKPSNREIAYFFDQSVFNGGTLGGGWVPEAKKVLSRLKDGTLIGMWVPHAKAFRSLFKNDGEMVGFVADWLATCISAPADKLLYGAKEGVANSKAWKAAVPMGTTLPDEQALLFAHGYLRALMSNGPPKVGKQPEQFGIFKAQVTSRRGMIALGAGKGNGVSWPGGVLEKK